MNKDSYNLWLMGGLGNQLFQINYGYRLKKQGHDVNFIDTLIKPSILTKKILSWTIHPNVLNQIVQVECQTLNPLPVFFAKTNMFNTWSNFLGCNEVNKKPKNIFGYFQCHELHDNIFFERDLSMRIRYDSRHERADIAAHLRFGDAPNLEKNIKYYTEVLNRLSEHKICICTDDKIFAKKFLEQIGFRNYYFSDGDLLDDFILLANAKIVVAAPSTFSFWAIKLSKRINEIYIPFDFYTQLGSPSKSTKVITI